MPGLHEFDQTAGLIVASGYYFMEELAGASASERAQLKKSLADGRPGWARLVRQMSDAEAPRTGIEAKKARLSKGVDVFADIGSDDTLQGVRAPLRPRQVAVNLLSEALREGGEVCPLRAPLLRPNLIEAPWAPQHPPRKRGAEAEQPRLRRYDVNTSTLNAEQLALSYLRFMVAGEIAGPRGNFGGFGALIANLAHFLELSVTQDVETTSCFERAQSPARPHLA